MLIFVLVNREHATTVYLHINTKLETWLQFTAKIYVWALKTAKIWEKQQGCKFM